MRLLKMIRAKFELEKETKGTYRYKEVSDIVTIGTLYIKKYAIDKPAKKIFVQIQEED